MDGVKDLLEKNIVSSIYDDNFKARHLMKHDADVTDNIAYSVLFDPQTSGGLLAGLPENQADVCLQALQEAGYSEARIIGKVRKLEPNSINPYYVHVYN